VNNKTNNKHNLKTKRRKAPGDIMKKTLLTLAAVSTLSMSAQAEQLWADNSVSVLYGSDYEFNVDEDTTTLTLEHVSGHSWGGLFYFVDRHNGGDYKETYGEFSPTFNLTKMEGMVTGINLAYTYEFGTLQTGDFNFADPNFHKAFDNHLVGLGVNLKIPGLNFASVTFYRAFNDGSDTDDNQLIVVAGYSNGNLNIDGFMDYAFGSENDGFGGEDSMNLTPQITYDIAPMLELKGKLKVGIEYSYWTNQFGIDGQDQNAVSLLLKAHL
jgi:nucleoside-specific outer membrane channel protein Tsx